MNEPAAPVGSERSLSIDDLSDLREKTDAVSQALQVRLLGHLETIQSLLAPRRVLGPHVRSGEGDSLPGADRAFEALKERYARYSVRPLSLDKNLEQDPISLDGRLELHPWEYRAKIGAEEKVVTMTSPLRWVLNYRSGYAPAALRDHVVDRQNLRREDAQRFVLSALTLAGLLEKHPPITALLRDLRYEIELAPYDGLGELPLVCISSCVPSFRPSDELILTATRFSGVPAFIEVVDTEAAKQLRDPIREQIEEILG